MSHDFGLWDVFLSMFWFMLLFAWISLIIHIFGDIFRDRSLSGGAKAFTPSAADELRKLTELRDGVVITAADYDTATAKVLA